MTDAAPTPMLSDPSSPRRRRPWVRRAWAVAAAAIALVAATAWAVDRWMRPEAAPAHQLSIEENGGGEDHPSSAAITARLDEPLPPDAHPLERPLEVAAAGLEYFRRNVRDYEALFIKQERVGSRLGAQEQARIKIRQQQGDAIPFSVYLRFEQPRGVAGREVIYVAGRNDGQLIAHEAGLLGLVRVSLHPTSRLAMRGNRFPITEIGIENLILRMIAKGERDAQHGECAVTVNRSIRVDGRRATEIRIEHPHPRPHFDFHIARILIDDELNLPVGFEGYGWPAEPGGKPILNERYVYTELRLNVGLADDDFDPDNPEYDFP